MTGLALVMGHDRSPHDAFLQAECNAQRIAAADLRGALRESRILLTTLLRYAYVWSVMLAQTALTNARGSIEERLARWLLMAHDRSGGDEIHLTHEFLSLMLGTRRAGVTTALNAFDTRGWIDHTRGRVTIIHRRGLGTACRRTLRHPRDGIRPLNSTPAGTWLAQSKTLQQ